MHELGQRFIVLVGSDEVKGRVISVVDGPPKKYVIRLLDGKSQVVVNEDQILQKNVL